MKKYFHQYSAETNQNLYRNSHHLHPFLNSKSLLKENTTSSFFKTNSTPKSINQLNLNNVTIKPKNQNSPYVNISKEIITNPNTYKNDLISTQNIPSPQFSKLTLRQSMQSIDSQRGIKQRGFSLQYIKMTKKHRIKQLINFNESQSSILMMMNTNKNQFIRSKTTFDQPLSRLDDDQNNYEIYNNEIANNRTNINLRSTQYHHNQPKNQTKLLSLLGNAQSIKQNLLLNKTLNDLKLPKTSSIFSKNKKTTNPLLTKIQFAGNILQSSHENKNLALIQNTPISFVPIDNTKINSDRKFFNNNNRTTTQFIDMGKTTLKKSKYSPFKSRNGSSASHNQDMKDIKTKQFQHDKQFQIKPFSTSKDVKNYKLTRHKRIKTSQNNQTQTTYDLQKKQLSIVDSQNTIKIIQQGLYGQIKMLNQLKQCFQITTNQSPSKSQKIPLNKIRQLIKLYVFGQKEQKQKIYKNQYFSQIDYIFQSQEEKHLIKKVISCQRLVIICIVDLLSHQKLLNLVEEVKLTLVTLIVMYLIVWKQVKKLETYENIDTQISEYFDNLLKTPNFKTQTPLEKHLKSSLIPYIENLYRYSKQLFEKQCKKLIQQSKSRTINRTFYQTLKKYAIYLTNNQERIIKKSSGGLISSFATCPAPYILSRPQKRYTLCVDLDETLLYSKFSCANKFQTSYRPGAKEFIIQLNKYFQIIVFTSSAKEYADQVIKPFVQFIDHTLYRYHVTRGKNLTNTVKDLSRVGRKLQKVIFIDDLECNIKLQPENSIKVTPWKGDMNDRQIIQLKGLLLALGKDETQHNDVRKIVDGIKQKMKNFKKKD